MLKKKADGGQIMQRKNHVFEKCTNEARGMFSVACPKVEGNTKGQFILTFWYTGQNFVCIDDWDTLK